jgi:hypothetical protein
MTSFSTVLSRLPYGSTMYRKSWPINTVIRYVGSQDNRMLPWIVMHKSDYEYMWTPSIDDLFATDWIVIEERKSNE